MTYDEARRQTAKASAVVKLVCGVGNNAAWLVMLDGYDHAKRCKRFIQSVKGGKISWLFKQAVTEFHNYERCLIHSSENRMFHVDDMNEEIRRKYGNITDQEYYDFWKGMGGVAYQQTRPMITSLWNKYRLSLKRHSSNDAEHVAWVMTAQAAIDLALAMFSNALNEAQTGFNLPRKLVEYVFGKFSLKRVSKAWMRAMTALAPEIITADLDVVEEKNIEFGLEQLMSAWLNPDLLYSSAYGAVEDYDEVFATPGFQKKALKEIETVRADTWAELEKQK